MALGLVNYVSEQSGITAPVGYMKVINVTVANDENGKRVIADFCIYFDKAAADSGKQSIGSDRLHYAFDVNSTLDVLAQSYLYASSLPVYVNATSI